MQFPEVADCNNVKALRQRGLWTGILGDIEAIKAETPRALGGGQCPRTGPKVAAQREFPINTGTVKSKEGQLFACGENADRECCIEARPAFPKAGWREVDDDTAHREFETAVLNCSTHTLSRLADRSIAESNNLKRREPLTDVYLNRHRNRSESLKSECNDAGEHSSISRLARRQHNPNLHQDRNKPAH
jgi:hypothetical protein